MANNTCARPPELYRGDGTTTKYSFSFPYINTTDIAVFLWDETTAKYVLCTEIAGQSACSASKTEYYFTNSTPVELFFCVPPDQPPTNKPTNFSNIIIMRETDICGMLAVFAAGSPIRASDLNNNFTQVLLSVQDVESKIYKAIEEIDVQPLVYKGTCDATSSVIPSPLSTGDIYTNSGTGGCSATWLAAINQAGPVTVAPGDLFIYEGPYWNIIPIGSGGTPGYPNVSDGQGSTLDTRYLMLNSGPSAFQSVQGDVEVSNKIITSSTISSDSPQTVVTKDYVDTVSVSDVTSVNFQQGDVVLNASDVGALAPGDNVSALFNDANYITVSESAVTSVNNKTGAVVLNANDVGAATTAQGATADTAVQPGDNVSELTNNVGYITDAGVVKLTAGTGITLNPSSGTGTVEITSAGGGGTSVEVNDTPPQNPTEGDLWWDSSSDSGKLYVWYEDDNSSQWVEASPSSGGGSGDLQTVTDAGNTTTNGAKFADGDIELKSDGSITAVTSGRQPNESTLVLNNTNIDGYSIYSQSNGTGTFAVSTAGSVLIGDAAGTVKTTLSADGSASFAGAVDVGSFVDGTSGTRITNSGTIYLNGSGSNAVFNANAGNAVINADGSATFAGNVNIGNAFTTARLALSAPYNQIGLQVIAASGSINIAEFRNSSGDLHASVNGTGAATFSGIATAKGLNLKPTDGTGGIYIIDKNDASKSSVVITEDGSATFAGIVKATRGIFRNNNDDPTVIGVDNSGSSNYSAIELYPDGSATFAKDVRAGDAIETASSSFAILDPSGQLFLQNNDTLGGKTIFAVYQGIYSSGNEQIRMRNNGDATFVGTVTATVVPPSDARFKENITPAKPQLADVVALGGLLKNYDWNDQAPLNEEIRSQRQLGLIAQEAAEVCPAIVKDIKRTKTVEVTPAVTGPKGRVITEAVTEELDDSYKGISTDALIMKLIGAVAELSAEVQAIKTGTNS